MADLTFLERFYNPIANGSRFLFPRIKVPYHGPFNRLHNKRRCRCEEMAAAVDKLKFYTVGTLRPDIIENYNRSGFTVTWIPHSVDYTDIKFSKPKANKILKLHELPDNLLSLKHRRIKQMWCPYMTPVRK